MLINDDAFKQLASYVWKGDIQKTEHIYYTKHLKKEKYKIETISMVLWFQ